jgi:hypothetical protein
MKMTMTLALLMSLALGTQARASVVTAEQVAEITQSVAMATRLNRADLINWKVGDSSVMNMIITGIKLGTLTKTASSEEGAALWVTQEIKILGQKQVVGILINRADGKILKTIINGKEQPASDEPDGLEIVSQEYTEVTVPAGTFKVIHLVARSESIPRLELWANPKEIVMDGTAKQAIATAGSHVMLELASQKRAE